MEKEREEISIEDLVEKERGNLGTVNLTKVTLETFVAWKKKKLKEKADAEKKEKVKPFSSFFSSGLSIHRSETTLPSLEIIYIKIPLPHFFAVVLPFTPLLHFSPSYFQFLFLVSLFSSFPYGT
jgi:hypothetical protein